MAKVFDLHGGLKDGGQANLNQEETDKVTKIQETQIEHDETNHGLKIEMRNKVSAHFMRVELPEEIISESILYRKLVKPRTPIEFLWASSREAYNYVQAEKSGCEIITMSPDLIKKVDKFGKDLDLFSIETVQMFYDDAVKSGYRID